MNKQKIKGIWNEVAGEVKEHLGRAVGNKELELKGHAQEMKGKVQKSASDLKDEILGKRTSANDRFNETEKF